MSARHQVVRLCDIAELNPRLSLEPKSAETVAFVPMSAVSAETGGITVTEERPYSEVKKGYTPFLNGDLLVAKITPCFENGKIAHATLPHPVGFGSTEFHVVRARSGVADTRYLLHYLRRDQVRRDGERKMTGSAGQRRVPEHFLCGLEVPLPPLSEQRRIAAVLDRAEALRAKRRAALAQFDDLAAAIFCQIFGDEEKGLERWPVTKFEQLLQIPLRNGLSPSHAGTVRAKVLTLSAITGTGFDADAWKESTFHLPPPPEQSVREDDFLVCRGNGNIRLVGKGYFPARAMPDMTFPDTMIAARVDGDRIDKTFLQHVWNSNAVRKQIESLARTTNGTFKVNQTVLERIKLIAPPIQLQCEFARRVRAVERIKVAHRASLAEMDALFASLQHRAFRGEL